MNKNLYRIIFSKVRNMFVVVGENTKSASKTAGQSTKTTTDNVKDDALDQHWVVKSLVLSMSAWMAIAPVYAQITPDAGAKPANRPVIGVGTNNQGQKVPVVNIQTPVNGISHNIYSQMDVLNNGVVLNNSRTGATSNLVGSVGANPFLAKGEARLILNEVNSKAATRFEGNLEVAGQRADVIIANPAGINIKGGGFINANKAIFTTGKPQFNADGSIKQFVVDQGKVTVSANADPKLGLGGNNNNANYVDIYARALELNAQLRANQDINVITGSNTISADLSDIKSQTSKVAAPALAVDVKSLGGMYANNIYLIGNEKGLGVSNAGTLQAVNNIVVTSAGKIENNGIISSTNKKGGIISLTTTESGKNSDININGSVTGYGLISVDSGNDLNLKAKNITINYDATTKNSADLIVNAKGKIDLATGTKISNLSNSSNVYIDAKNINLASKSEILSNHGSASIHAEESLTAADAARLITAADLNIEASKNLKLIGSTLQATKGSINLQSVSDATSMLQLDKNTIRAGKDLNIYGAGDVALKEIKTDIVKNITIQTKNKLNFEKINILSNDGDISFISNGFMNGQGVDVISKNGSVTFQSNSDLNIIPQKKVVRDNKLPNLDLVIYDNNNISGGKGVNFIALGLGDINIKNTNVNAEKSPIQFHGNNIDVDFVSGTSFIDFLFTGYTPTILNERPFFNDINSNGVFFIAKDRLNLNSTNIESTGNKVFFESLGDSNFKNTNIASKGNIEVFSNKINSKNMELNSEQHVAFKSKYNIDLNKVSVNNKGVLSLISGGKHGSYESDFNAGAILLEAKSFDKNSVVSLESNNSDILRKDSKLNKINGNLSIQVDDTLMLGDKIKINSFSNIELVSKKGDLTLLGNGGNKGRGSEELFTVNSQQGDIKLEGERVLIDASRIKAEKNVEILSSKSDIKIDAVKNTFLNSDSLFKSKEFLDDYEILKKAYNGDSFYKAEVDFLKKYPVIPISVMNFMGNDITLLQNPASFSNDFYPVDKVYKFKGEEKYVDLLSGNSGYSHTGTNIISNKGDIYLKSTKGISISGSDLVAKTGKVDIEANGALVEKYTTSTKQVSNGKTKTLGASVILDGTQDFYDKGNENDTNYSFKTIINPTIISGAKGVHIKAFGKGENDNLIMQATGVTSQNGDVRIEANKNILFDAAIEQSYDRSTSTEKKKSWGGLKNKHITTTNENNNIDAASVDIQAKNIFIESKEKNPNNSIDIYSGKFIADGGKVSIRSGGNLNFYTVEESSSSKTDVTKKSSFAGIKYNTAKTNSTRTQVNEIPATLKADYIGTKSGFDTRLEGTEFTYLKGATIESGGKLELIAAKTTIKDLLKKEKNSVVWQSMQDKGSITETAQLPQFNGPVLPTFKAAGGLSVQIPVSEKDQNKVVLRNEILKLANQPGNDYLKELVNRKDVDWNTIILAQKDWDFKSQGLTGAGAALIVIVVTIVTMGTGTAAAAGTAGAGAATGGTTVGLGASMLGTAGVTTTTVGGVTTITGISTLGTMANAAITSLATQASVGIINNGGDIGKTLKDLGGKDSVRNLVGSVVTAGIMSKVGTALNLKPDSSVFNDRLYANLVNSTGSALINTTINGGDFADNFQAAILNGLMSTIQGELALQIGVKLDIKNKDSLQYIVHKVAHAAAGCVAGSIQKECLATAVGATMGEVMASIFPNPKNGYEYNAEEKRQIANAGKLVAGTLAAFLGYDVNISSNAADIAIKNNTLQLKGNDLEKKKIINLLNASSESKIKFDYDKKGRIVPLGYHYDDSKNPPILVGTANLNGVGVIDGTVIRAMKDANLIILELSSDPLLLEGISIDDYKLGYVNTASLSNPNNKTPEIQLLHVITERLETRPGYYVITDMIAQLKKKADEVNALEGTPAHKKAKDDFNKMQDDVNNKITQMYVPAHTSAINNETEYLRQLFPERVIINPNPIADPLKSSIKNGVAIATEVRDFGGVTMIIEYEHLGYFADGRFKTGKVISSRYQ